MLSRYFFVGPAVPPHFLILESPLQGTTPDMTYGAQNQLFHCKDFSTSHLLWVRPVWI